jgi:Arc/MetJ-type ribon-helix-helix transcriptional regulator
VPVVAWRGESRETRGKLRGFGGSPFDPYGELSVAWPFQPPFVVFSGRGRFAMPNQSLSIVLPADLWAEIQERVASGEFVNVETAIEAALRYYLDRHSREAWAEYVAEEVRTGLDASA